MAFYYRILRILLVLLLPFGLQAQSDLGIIPLNSDKGLSNNIVTSIIQDEKGYIWIGTEHGLNKYNAYNLKVYSHIPNNNTSINGNKINDLYVDSEGKLWITTNYNGVSIYNERKDDFINFKNSNNDITSLSLDMVNTIAEDVNNNVWIGTYFGLNSIDRDLELQRHFTNFSITVNETIIECLKENNIPKNIIEVISSYDKREFVNINEFKSSLIAKIGIDAYKKYEKKLFCWGMLAFSDESQYDEKIMSVAPDKDGNLWLALYENGIVHYNTSNHTYRFYTAHQDLSEHHIRSNDANSLLLNNHDLWIGGTSGWIDRYDTKKKEYFHYKLDDENTIFKIKEWRDNTVYFITEQGLCLYDARRDTILSQNDAIKQIFKEENIGNNKNIFGDKIITSLLKDNNHNLWIGTKTGVYCIENCKKFKVLQNEVHEQNSIYRGDVTALASDGDNIYIGYLNSTFDIMDIANGEIERFEYFEGNPFNLGQGSIQTINIDNNKKVWIGSFGGGAQQYNPTRKDFITVPLDKEDVNHLGNHDVRALCADSEGKIWIALNGGGLSCYNPQTKELLRFKADYANWQTSLHENWLISIYCDAHDNIWTGSYNGLSIYNQKTKTFRSFKTGNSGKTITNNTVNTFHESIDGKMWIGTNAGIDLYSPKDSSFTHISIAIKKFKASVFGILEDSKQNLWISTNKGIFKYNIKTENLTSYTTRDGLLTNEFIINAKTRNSKGTMYFGGKNGITYFNPDSISKNPYAPPVVLTGLKLFYEDISISDSTNAILKENISTAKNLVFEYHQNIITFEYAALNYINSEKNQYEYTLEGFDEKWHAVGKKREATYTSLNPGEYTFRVRACNNDGEWNMEGTSINVTVLPPWWQTWWFRGIILLFMISAIVGYVYYKSYQLKKQNRVLEQKVQIRTEELTVANQEIMSQNEQISSQRDELEKQNRMIKQSITSGQRIQSALLPSDAVIQSYFDDYFVMYNPRDIVSGDFYWSHWVNGHLFVIASDCTGHGIPGAFMSMLGNAMLNEIIIKSKILDPAQILTELNKSVQDTFKGTKDGPNAVDEGMDITVAAIDTKRNKLLISSALQPYYLAIDGKLKCIQGDMYSIGEIFSRIQEPEFTTHTYDIVPNMCLYIGSDGIVDQFSSETKKKFTTKRLIQVLEENCTLSMQSQAGSILEAFERWKGSEPQLDDIMLLGMRFQ